MDLQIDNVIPFMGREPISLYVKDGKFASGPSAAGDRLNGGSAAGSALAGQGSRAEAGGRLDLKGALALPGLINSHDHLEFNCFPALGDRKHTDYVAWGKDIHGRYKAEIDAVLRIPGELRARWGVYKNLLGGVTTVLQHGRSWAQGPVASGGQGQTGHPYAWWKTHSPFIPWPWSLVGNSDSIIRCAGTNPV